MTISKKWSSIKPKSLLYRKNIKSKMKGYHLVYVIAQCPNPKQYTHLVWDIFESALYCMDLREIQKNAVYHVPPGTYKTPVLNWQQINVEIVFSIILLALFPIRTYGAFM